jgi:hypothetical protein
MKYTLELQSEEVFSLEQALGVRIIQLLERMEESISGDDEERYNRTCQDLEVCQDLALRVHKIGNEIVEAFEESVIAENLESLDQELKQLLDGGK